MLLSTGVERQGARQVRVVVPAVVMVVVVDAAAAGFLLDPPPEVEEVINRAREPERAVRVVPIDLVRLVELPPEERVIQVGYRDHEPLDCLVFILQPHLNCHEPLLHLHLLVILQHRRSLDPIDDDRTLLLLLDD